MSDGGVSTSSGGPPRVLSMASQMVGNGRSSVWMGARVCVCASRRWLVVDGYMVGAFKATGVVGGGAVCVFAHLLMPCGRVDMPARVAARMATRSRGGVSLADRIVGGTHAVGVQLQRQRGRPRQPLLAALGQGARCAALGGAAGVHGRRRAHSSVWMGACLARQGLRQGRSCVCVCTAPDVCVHVDAPVRVAACVATRSGGISLARGGIGGIHAVEIRLQRQRGRPVAASLRRA